MLRSALHCTRHLPYYPSSFGTCTELRDPQLSLSRPRRYSQRHAGSSSSVPTSSYYSSICRSPAPIAILSWHWKTSPSSLIDEAFSLQKHQRPQPSGTGTNLGPGTPRLFSHPTSLVPCASEETWLLPHRPLTSGGSTRLHCSSGPPHHLPLARPQWGPALRPDLAAHGIRVSRRCPCLFTKHMGCVLDSAPIPSRELTWAVLSARCWEPCLLPDSSSAPVQPRTSGWARWPVTRQTPSMVLFLGSMIGSSPVTASRRVAQDIHRHLLSRSRWAH